VSVSSLKFIRELSSLAAGFNFGAFQLWNLSANQCREDFSSPYLQEEEEDSLPIVDFVFQVSHKLCSSAIKLYFQCYFYIFQEPENDPRHFCYLWTCKCETYFESVTERASSVDSKCQLELHSLSYDSKDEDEQFGVFYSGLRDCRRRFSHHLDSPDEVSWDK